jgi:hypothetical protein
MRAWQCITRITKKSIVDTKPFTAKASQLGYSMKMDGQFATLSTATSSYAVHNSFLRTCRCMVSASAHSTSSVGTADAPSRAETQTFMTNGDMIFK